MTILRRVPDVILWAGWIAAAATQDVPMLAILCFAAVTLLVARSDWDNGVRPFTSVK